MTMIKYHSMNTISMSWHDFALVKKAQLVAPPMLALMPANVATGPQASVDSSEKYVEDLYDRENHLFFDELLRSDKWNANIEHNSSSKELFGAAAPYVYSCMEKAKRDGTWNPKTFDINKRCREWLKGHPELKGCRLNVDGKCDDPVHTLPSGRKELPLMPFPEDYKGRLLA